MKKISIFLIAFVTCAFCDEIPLWEQYKKRYGIRYKTPAEDKFRMRIFLNNMDRINEHNARYMRKEVSFELAMNQFGAHLDSEVPVMVTNEKNGLPGNLERCVFPKFPEKHTRADVAYDLRKENRVTPVKDQGDCNSAWAFSTLGVLEGFLSAKGNKLEELSAQNLIDCSMNDGNLGCKGGSPFYGLQYVINEKMIDRSASYPYTARTGGKCRVNETGKAIAFNVNNTGGVSCAEQGYEESLEMLVRNYGPVSVTVDASSWNFRFYKSGIYHDDKCCSSSDCVNHVNHAMLVVGYDSIEPPSKGVEYNATEPSKYWLVKNSWGGSWGESGYIKMPKDFGNHCGIATSAITYTE